MKYLLASRLRTQGLDGDVRKAYGILREWTGDRLLSEIANEASRSGRHWLIFESTNDLDLEQIRQIISTGVSLEPHEFRQFPQFTVLVPSDIVKQFALTGEAVQSEQLRVTVEVVGNGFPLDKVDVYVLTYDPESERVVQCHGRTSPSGIVTFTLEQNVVPVLLVASPYSSFWGALSRIGPSTTSHRFELIPLEVQSSWEWWHNELNLPSSESDSCANSIRVGVIDTGCGMHPAVSSVSNMGAMIDGIHHPNKGHDISGHGTSICGVIGARACTAANYPGVAPSAVIATLRIYKEDSTTSKIDIANAIDLLVDNGVDLINISSGWEDPSDIEHDAIGRAFNNGVVCVCSAGNTASDILYPAAYVETVSVSAYGKQDTFPPDTLSASRIPADMNLMGRGQLFIANFCCSGESMSCCAPGVGISAPTAALKASDALYAVGDGTSLASAVATGVLARYLSKSPEFKCMKRTKERSEYILKTLFCICATLGVDKKYEGNGSPVFK